jgi:hypothetical protein
MRSFQFRPWSNAVLVALCTLLGACASNPPAPTQTQQMAAIAPWAGKGQLLMIEVPAASNAISNQMVVASLKLSGSSNAADQIVQVLRSGSAATVAVTGSNLEVNAATVQAALRGLSSPPVKTQTTLLMVGRPNDSAELEKAASAVGVKLEFANLP